MGYGYEHTVVEPEAARDIFLGVESLKQRNCRQSSSNDKYQVVFEGLSLEWVTEVDDIARSSRLWIARLA